MQTVLRILFPKLVQIAHPEILWVKNLLNIAKKDPNIKKACLEWQPGTYPKDIIGSHPGIEKDGHTGGTLCWTVKMVQGIITSGSKIRKHKHGFSYNPFG